MLIGITTPEGFYKLLEFITQCDVVMSGHYDVILIDLHWPDWSPFGDHILVYQIKSGHVME